MGRSFCGWFCPLAGIQEASFKVRTGKPIINITGYRLHDLQQELPYEPGCERDCKAYKKEVSIFFLPLSFPLLLQK
ncbi:MAG: 4Fe-4S binding protein [Candidatus Mariimomonas ferrooxydans]